MTSTWHEISSSLAILSAHNSELVVVGEGCSAAATIHGQREAAVQVGRPACAGRQTCRKQTGRYLLLGTHG